MTDDEKAQLIVDRVNEGNPDMSFLDDLWEKVAFITLYRAQNAEGLAPFMDFVKDNLQVIVSENRNNEKVYEVLDRLKIARIKIQGGVQ